MKSDEIQDAIGTVTKADFLEDFEKSYVDKHFNELAHAWFKCLSAQIDFSMVLDAVKYEFKEGLK